MSYPGGLSRLAWAGLLLCLGCNRPSGDRASLSVDASGAADPRAEAGAARAKAKKPKLKGRVHGTVRLAEGAELPLGPDPTASGSLATSSGSCPEVGAHDRRVMKLDGASRGLSPVHVALTGMWLDVPVEPVTHEIYLDGCRLSPTLVGVVRGDRVRLKNRSAEPFVPVLAGQAFGSALAAGASTEFDVDYLGSRSVACQLGNYCGSSLLIGLAHRLQDVTDAVGRFEIRGVPLDQKLTIHAWHPLLREGAESFTLTEAAPEKELVLTLQAPAAVPVRAANKPPAKKNGQIVPD